MRLGDETGTDWRSVSFFTATQYRILTSTMDSPSNDENLTNHDDIFSPQLMRHITQLAGEAYIPRVQKEI